MEDVVSEKLQHVSVTVFGPGLVAVELRPVHDGGELGEEAEEAGRLDVSRQLGFHQIYPLVGFVQRNVETGSCGQKNNAQVQDAFYKSRVN